MPASFTKSQYIHLRAVMTSFELPISGFATTAASVSQPGVTQLTRVSGLRFEGVCDFGTVTQINVFYIFGYHLTHVKYCVHEW